jgi:DNA-binding response OmpR family regulator
MAISISLKKMHPSNDHHRQSILIVDHSNIEQHILIESLGRQAYRYSSARNGSQAYQLALSLMPDLILLGARLPDMDGFSACRLLKANSVTSRIPVIFMSCATEVRDRVKGFAVGGVDFVTKPFAPEELSARIQVHLNLAAHKHIADRRSSAMKRPIVVDEEDVTVTAAKRFILEHLSDELKLNEIARAVGTYREKLSPLFRMQTGLSIFEYIRQCRVAHGQKLLAETNLDVQEICLMAGYNNGGNFATAFREQTGMTPMDYRRRLKQTALTCEELE